MLEDLIALMNIKVNTIGVWGIAEDQARMSNMRSLTVSGVTNEYDCLYVIPDSFDNMYAYVNDVEIVDIINESIKPVIVQLPLNFNFKNLVAELDFNHTFFKKDRFMCLVGVFKVANKYSR